MGHLAPHALWAQLRFPNNGGTRSAGPASDPISPPDVEDIEHMFYSVGRGSWSLAGASPLHGGVGRTVERVAHSGAFQGKRKITGKPRKQRDTWREATQGRTGSGTMRWGLAGWRLRQQRTHGEGRQQSHSRPRVAQAAAGGARRAGRRWSKSRQRDGGRRRDADAGHGDDWLCGRLCADPFTGV